MDTSRPLHFITCGSVDDGKSTLLGRLLHDAGAVFEDHLRRLEVDSRRFGTQGGLPDLALLLDGLQAEREQKITIDVAHRFFRTARRRFIAADSPGHEQYTRNMATAASMAELALILVDARHGVRAQTIRHSRIIAMMGVRHVVLVVNKMDLVDYSQARFDDVVREYRSATADLRSTFRAMPVCAVSGDNVAVVGARMPWFSGGTLLNYLEDVCTDESVVLPLRLPIQWANRSTPEFRGVSGRIASGTLRQGDAIVVLPSGVVAEIQEVIVGFDQVNVATSGDSVTVVARANVDIGRGDVLVASNDRPRVATEFDARLIWFGDQPVQPGYSCILRIHTKDVRATVASIEHKEDVDLGQNTPAESLFPNEFGLVRMQLQEPVAIEPYQRCRQLGAFILVDANTFQTVGAGMVGEDSGRSPNDVRWQPFHITKAARAAQKNQKAVCIWLTGLPASGKSTIADLVERTLHASGRHTYVIDGDNLRHGLSRDLGFAESDRSENVRRAAEAAKLMVDAGLIVLVSLVSPGRSDRAAARALFEADEMVEVFVDTPLHECERRDPKGLYRRARAGSLRGLTGIDSPYEDPLTPDLHLRTVELGAAGCVEALLRLLERRI